MNDESGLNLETYSPSQQTRDLINAAKIMLIVGPTGAGKDTVEAELTKTNDYYKLITLTTRPPRENHGVMEVSGDSYYFVSVDEMKAMIRDKKLVEVALIHGNIYATSAAEFEKAQRESKIVVADIDIQGVRSYRRLTDKLTSVFLLPPSFKIMLARLSKRYGEANMTDIKARLTTALNELYELKRVDYYQVVINDDLQETLRIINLIASSGTYNATSKKHAEELAEQLMIDIKAYLDN